MPSGPASAPATSASRRRVEMADAEQDRGNRGDVVAGIGDAGLEPAVADRHGREVGFDPIAERHEAPDDENDVDEIEIAHRQRQKFLDRRAAVEQHQAGGGDHAQRADQFRQAEQAVRDLSGRRAHDRHDDDDQQEVGDLEQEPAAPEQQLEERSVVVSARDARQLETDHQHRAPHEHAHHHAQQAAPRAPPAEKTPPARARWHSRRRSPRTRIQTRAADTFGRNRSLLIPPRLGPRRAGIRE